MNDPAVVHIPADPVPRFHQGGTQEPDVYHVTRSLSDLNSPWKVLLYREALIWRMVELSKRAFESFTSDQLVCGIVLTRAVLEVSAAL